MIAVELNLALVEVDQNRGALRNEQGIRERGSHDELVQKNGLYATFYKTTLKD